MLEQYREKLLKAKKNAYDEASRKKFTYDTSKNLLKEYKEMLSKSLKDLPVAMEAKAAVETMAMLYEEKSIRRDIEKLIDKVISSIYGNDGTHYRFVKKFQNAQHQLVIVQVKTSPDGKEFTIPMSNTEGGCRDIVDTIIRMLLIKTCPESDRVMLFDEPMKNLDYSKRNGAFAFFLELARIYKIQMNLISHESDYLSQVDSLITLTQTNNETKVVE